MCTDVYVRDVYCHTRGELEAALGGPVLPADPEWPADCCLCPLDIEATAAKYSLPWKRDDWGDVQLGEPVEAREP
jgi:hypothetical protein